MHAVRRPRRRSRLAVPVAATLLVLAGCSGAEDEPAPVRGAEVLVSIGDSYAVGYRPAAEGTDAKTTSADNFPADVAESLSTDGRRVQVTNFGCAGATSLDLLETLGCDEGRRAPGGQAYADVTQADAAEVYLEANQGRIAAVTVVIGGNDLGACFTFVDGQLANDPSPCVFTALEQLRTRLSTLLPRLRAAAGPDVPIVGVTYPDVYLSLWVRGQQDLAEQSLALFGDQLNPLLQQEYSAVGGTFANVTEAFDGAVPLTTTASAPGFGTVPQAVATVCELTYACSQDDTHPTTEGHRRIAETVLAAMGGGTAD